MNGSAENLVVGGGPAGAACATLLARAGREVVLMERSVGPHDKVCGAFLSTEALTSLRMLGLDPLALGAVPIRELGLWAQGQRAEIPLPFAAAGLTRRVLDEALLRRAARAGVEVRRGTAVRALGMRDGAWRVRLGDDTEIAAKAAFIATGKHDLRAWPRPTGLQSDLVGFNILWRPGQGGADILSGTVELILFPGGYAGLAPVGQGLLNLCLLIRRHRFAELSRRWETVVSEVAAAAPSLNGLLTGAKGGEPRAIGAIPFGYLHRRDSAAWHLGDQAAVVPSFTGTGISLAFHSAFLAAGAYLTGGGTPSDYRRRLARDAWRLVYPATALSALLVRPAAQAALVGAARWMPWLMTSCAAATRLRSIPVTANMAPLRS